MHSDCSRNRSKQLRFITTHYVRKIAFQYAVNLICLFVSTIFNEGAYLSIFHKALKDSIFAILQFENFENLERATVSLSMLSAEQD